MNARFTLSIELLSPVDVRSAYDLAQLDPSVVSKVVVLLEAESEGDLSVPSLDLAFDHRRVQLIDLVEFSQSIQPEGTRVLLMYQGRSEEFRF